MRQSDTKLVLFTAKLIGMLCVASVVIIFAPQYAHHILLVIAVVLCFLGVGALLKYKTQSEWVEKKAVLKSINECEEEIAISEYSRIKYYYPEVEYEYAANGITHLGKMVSLEKENIWVPEVNNWGITTPQEEKWWSSLKPGDELPVYVNPLNEKESVLINVETKSRRSHHLALIVSGILLGVIWIILENCT